MTVEVSRKTERAGRTVGPLLLWKIGSELACVIGPLSPQEDPDSTIRALVPPDAALGSWVISRA